MKQIKLTKLLYIFLWALLGIPAVASGESCPNIVFIFADDFGLSDIDRHHFDSRGVPGGAPTPTIDTLIDDGVWFTDAHSPAALCAPSRWSVMTGNYNYRCTRPGGIWGQFDDNEMLDGDTTIGRVAQRSGYNTGFIGKWHFGGDYFEAGSTEIYRGKEEDALTQADMTKWIANNPSDLGFGYDYTLPHGVQGPSYLAYENGEWAPLAPNSQLVFLEDATFDSFQLSAKGEGPGDSNWNAYNLNEVLADKAVTFINAAAGGADPFFLYFSSPAVHVPHTPAAILDGVPIAGTTVAAHTDMIRVLDWEVKKIVDALKANNVYNNTVVMFTSDNGGLNYTKNQGHFSSGILRGDKDEPYEGGHRVPLVVTWPDVIPAGTTNDHMIAGTDFVATIADLAGGTINHGEARDSYSFAKILTGDPSYVPRTEMVNMGGTPRAACMRQGDWKLIIDTDKFITTYTPRALFNLADNLEEDEAQNFIDDPAHAAQVDDMLNYFISLRTSDVRTVSHDVPCTGLEGVDPVLVSQTPALTLHNIGGNHVAGSLEGDYDGFVYKGAGLRYYLKSDEFTFASTEVSGDFDMKARIDSIDGTGSSKLGIMMRNSLVEGDPYVAISMRKDGKFVYQARVSSGDAGVSEREGTVAFPHWIRLKRQDNILLAYQGNDGMNWNLLACQSIEYEEDVFVGFSTHSQSESAFTTSVVRHVELLSETALGPYLAWASGYFSAVEMDDSGISGESGDPDQDGIINLFERFHGYGPTVANAASIYIDRSNEDVDLYVPVDPGVTDYDVVLEYSEDLETWSQSLLSAPVTGVNYLGYPSRKYTYEGSIESKLFFRMRLQRRSP